MTAYNHSEHSHRSICSKKRNGIGRFGSLCRSILTHPYCFVASARVILPAPLIRKPAASVPFNVIVKNFTGQRIDFNFILITAGLELNGINHPAVLSLKLNFKLFGLACGNACTVESDLLCTLRADIIACGCGSGLGFVVIVWFVTLFITQIYKELVEKANLNLRRNQTETAILKRNAYFILDEFGNLPKFDNLEGMITVGRSRGIRFLLVLQSFSQMNAKYGRDIADVVKTNCNVKIFIGSDDAETRKEFSELCGNKKIKQFSVNTNAENPASSNTGASNQPLITVGMLERINGDEKGDAIVSVRGYEPI